MHQAPPIKKTGARTFRPLPPAQRTRGPLSLGGQLSESCLLRIGCPPQVGAGACGLILFFCVFFLAACATSPRLPEESGPVMGLMAERLRLAREVAWVKHQNSLPIHDPEQESAVTAKLVRQGERAGIEEALVLRFVRSQMEASRLEQEAWMSRWRKGEPLPDGEPPSLESLRTRLDRLSSLLLAEWAAAPTTPRTAAARYLLEFVQNPRSASIAASGFVNPNL